MTASMQSKKALMEMVMSSAASGSMKRGSKQFRVNGAEVILRGRKAALVG